MSFIPMQMLRVKSLSIFMKFHIQLEVRLILIEEFDFYLKEVWGCCVN